MNLDLRVYLAQIRQEAPVVADQALVALLTTVAVLYSLGRRVGSAYFTNREAVDSSVRQFFTSLTVGAKTAYSTAYQLGVDTRGAYEANKEPIQAKLNKLDRYVMDGYGYTVALLEDLKTR